jgi:hypothetical protein
MSQHDPLRCMRMVKANLGISYNALEQDDLGRVVMPWTESRCQLTHWTAEGITNMMRRDYIDSQTYTLVSTIASLALRHRHHLHKHGLLLNRERRRRCLVQIAVLILECCEVHQLSNKRKRKKKNRQETHFVVPSRR